MKELKFDSMNKIAGDYAKLHKVFERFKTETAIAYSNGIPLDYIFSLPKKLKAVMLKKQTEKILKGLKMQKIMDRSVGEENEKRHRMGDPPMDPEEEREFKADSINHKEANKMMR